MNIEILVNHIKHFEVEENIYVLNSHYDPFLYRIAHDTTPILRVIRGTEILTPTSRLSLVEVDLASAWATVLYVDSDKMGFGAGSYYRRDYPIDLLSVMTKLENGLLLVSASDHHEPMERFYETAIHRILASQPLI